MKEEFEVTYKALFRRYYAGLLFYATRLVGEDDAEDIVQDVFVEVWRRQDTVEIGEQFQSFLYRSVYTKAINLLKHKAVAESYNADAVEFYQKKLDYYQPDHTDVISRIENRELRSELHRAIDELPDKCREVFKLSYLHDMKNKDIADVMGISLRTVEAHMYKALKVLRERLKGLRF
ncbi:MAG TPA: RNA polymerase sigma-70 factor [Candidatus Phocaeicola caecigallinarum]|nr:RNA polymerase sigma-70 factor [Candidatus Phocaeicola caecigallinarum]